ncbi:MAG: response regulator [Dermatophilaceae bacterium]
MTPSSVFTLGRTPMIRLLFADDHHAIRVGVGALVSTDPGIELVATAATGEAAVALTGIHLPDVVLMDLSMPGRGGLWALREIRRLRPGTALVVLTSDGRAATRRAAWEAGADRLVLKGEPAADLLDAVRAAKRTPREPQGPATTING